MGIVKKVNESYDVLFDMKKEFNHSIFEALDVYDNVDFKDYAVGKSTPSKDNINISLLQDVQTAAKRAGVQVDITTAVSGHNHTPSRHPSGNAVDIAIINGKPVNKSNRKDVDKFVDELVKLGYVKNTESGNEKSVLTFGFPNHDNHVHVSNKKTEKKDDVPSDEKETDTLSKLVKVILKKIGLNEEKVYGKFGDGVQSRYGVYVIPKDSNQKIKSPVNGSIISGTYNSSCTNQILIAHEINGRTFYLEYCGISNPIVGIGDSVGKGTTLGKTDTDVSVTLYDNSNRKDSIDSYTNLDIVSGNINQTSKRSNKKKSGRHDNDDNDDYSYGGKSKGFSLTDNDDAGVLSTLLQLPFKPFQNKRDASGRVIEKNWVSPTAKQQPKSWFGKLKSPTSNKLKEDIDRIKGLLK